MRPLSTHKSIPPKREPVAVLRSLADCNQQPLFPIAHGNFSFEGSMETGHERGEIKLYDLQGRMVAQPVVLFNDGAWQAADPQLKAGMYMYRLFIDGTEVQHGKIVMH